MAKTICRSEKVGNITFVAYEGEKKATSEIRVKNSRLSFSEETMMDILEFTNKKLMNTNIKRIGW